jgi:CheY-like chemotaxis protein
MSQKVLLVDDEPAVLSVYQQMLPKDLEVHTAPNGDRGLEALRERGPFSLIVSDMRMPGMTGAAFLSHACQSSPETTRMLLTGYTDIAAAIQAVNEGRIFRFLTKPCTKSSFTEAVYSGLQQYAVVQAEKALLEKTVLGSIRVLADFLGAASPEAHGRSMRIAHVVQILAERLRIPFTWQLDAAATLSQIGCVTLDAELIRKACTGGLLTPEEQTRFETHPCAAMRLLSEIPRLEAVAWMIGHQLYPEIPRSAPVTPASNDQTVLGATMLKLAVAYDNLLLKPYPPDEAVLRLKVRKQEFPGVQVDALGNLPALSGRKEPRRVRVEKLGVGMIVDEELRNDRGVLLIPKGQEITGALLIKINNYAEAGIIGPALNALVPI